MDCLECHKEFKTQIKGASKDESKSQAVELTLHPYNPEIVRR